MMLAIVAFGFLGIMVGFAISEPAFLQFLNLAFLKPDVSESEFLNTGVVSELSF